MNITRFIYFHHMTDNQQYFNLYNLKLHLQRESNINNNYMCSVCDPDRERRDKTKNKMADNTAVIWNVVC